MHSPFKIGTLILVATLAVALLAAALFIRRGRAGSRADYRTRACAHCGPGARAHCGSRSRAYGRA